MTTKTADPLYPLRLTRDELWALMSGYEASFTDPQSRNEVEMRVSEKLDAAYRKAHAARSRRGGGSEPSDEQGAQDLAAWRRGRAATE